MNHEHFTSQKQTDDKFVVAELRRRVRELEHDNAKKTRQIENGFHAVKRLENELNQTRRALWFVRVMLAGVYARFNRYMFIKLCQMGRQENEFTQRVLNDYNKWSWVERKCRQYDDKIHQ